MKEPFRFNENRMSYKEQLTKTGYRFVFALERIAEHFPEAKKKRLKILDVGCGPGIFLGRCIKEGFNPNNLMGVDIDSKVREAAKKNTKVKIVASIDFPQKNAFDVVTCFSAVEHVKEYKKFLQKIWNKVAPGGMMIVIVPMEGQLDDHDHKWWFDFYDVLEFGEIIKPAPADYGIYMLNKLVRKAKKLNMFALIVFK